MKGYRKLIMFALGALVIATERWTGPFSSSQVELFQTLILAAFAGNGLEYVAEVVKDANSRRRSVGAISSVRSVTAPKTEPAAADAH